jgi:acetyl-CoA acetyltransferase
MIDTPEKQAVISGIGLSRMGRKTGVSGLDMTLESARAAIADAGLTPADIDGVATMGETPLPQAVEALGLEPRYRGGGFDTGGLLSPVMSAFLAVASGAARHVLVYRTVQMLGGLPRGNRGRPAEPQSPSAASENGPPTRMEMGGIHELLAFHAYAAPNWLAMHCQRHMAVYGTTKEQLGWLAVNSRRNAGLNPLAIFRDPITLDDYMNARPISTPFGLLDCDVPLDGSVSVVVSAAAYAKDCPRPAIRVEAIGGAEGDGGWYRRPDYPNMASTDAAAQMWARTHLKPKDIDIAELYDGFTFITFAWLEALGICGKGESGPFVEGATRIALDGVLPLNTYGGQLSAGRMHGYWVLHEACLQLRGDAGARQVAKTPHVAAVAAGGGPIAGCMLLTL